MNKFDSQISRMKAMMNYGLQTENKNQYSTVEYNRVGADGKMYGIVREGTKYYIKVSNKTDNVIKENFDYIGGFRNRKDYEYSSYANALKQFELKMRSINEAANKKDSIVIDSWNPDRKEMLTVESTNKMRKEIARQRQIMGNVVCIQEKKNYTVDLQEADCCCKVDKECAATQKDNIKKKSDGKGEPTGQGGDPFTVKSKKCVKIKGKKECKPVMEGENVLAWNDNEEYLDTTHGTEIGDTAPFTEPTDKKMSVEEGVALHAQGDNQNSPAVGVGEVGDDAPFEEKAELQEEYEMEEEPMEDDFDDEEEVEDEFVDDEEMVDSDDVDFDSDLDDLEDDEESEDDFEDDEESDEEVDERLSEIEDILTKLAEKFGVSTFDDDSLYDDEDVDMDDEEESEYELELDDENDEDIEDMDDEEDVEVFESKNFRKAMLKEDEFHYFGQHPAYQKEPMNLPNAKHAEKQGYFDMNDDSVEDESAFGEEIGNSAPFEVTPESIENAIAESITRIMKKKI